MSQRDHAVPARLVGIHLDDAMFTAALALHGRMLDATIALPTAVGLDADRLVMVGASDGTHSEVLARLGEPSMVALLDTYYSAEDLLTALLTALRRDAERLAGGTLSTAAVAHPASWGPRQRHLLVRACGAAGFSDVDLAAGPEAAAWAPTHGPGPSAPGLLMIIDLGGCPTVSLLDTGAGGWQLLGHLPVRQSTPPGAVAETLLRQSGRARADLREVRAVGTGATDPARVESISRELGGRVQVPTDPAAAVAVGAVHRRLGSPIPLADLTVRLTWLATRADDAGDARTAASGRTLAQEIYEFRMGIHTPAPATAFAATMAMAEALLVDFVAYPGIGTTSRGTR